MKHLAIYARVSTDPQTVEPQLHALREYALRRSLEPVEYVDAGVSGAKDRRPALDQLLADCRKRKVDAVAVVRLDRLARSVRHLVTLADSVDGTGAVDLLRFSALRRLSLVLESGSSPCNRFAPVGSAPSRFRWPLAQPAISPTNAARASHSQCIHSLRR